MIFLGSGDHRAGLAFKHRHWLLNEYVAPALQGIDCQGGVRLRRSTDSHDVEIGGVEPISVVGRKSDFMGVGGMPCSLGVMVQNSDDLDVAEPLKAGNVTGRSNPSCADYSHSQTGVRHCSSSPATALW